MDHDQKSYHFINEVIKEKKADKKTIFVRVAALVGAAVLFGVTAAVTFAWVEPYMEKAIHKQEKPPKVDIPSDDEPSQTPVPSPQDSSSGSSETSSQSQEDDSNSSEGSDQPQEGSFQQSIGLVQYKQLYKDMLEVAEKPKHALVTVIGISNQMDYFNQNYETQQQISGLVVAENGQDIFVLTEYRVVENVERIQVTFWDGTMMDAIYQKHDSNTGLTILKVPLADLGQETLDGIEIAPLGNSYSVTQGEPIFALGSPIGYSDSVAYGVVTSVNNKISTIDTEYNLLTTDIIGSKEGSGILVNLDGEIVGIIAQNYSSEDKNIITGLAISQIKKLIEQLSNNQQLPYLGIKGQDVTSEISEKTGIPKGILVKTVQPDSPAMMSGIKEYDVIVRFGDDKVSTVKQYHEKLSKCDPGQVIQVTAMRKGAEGYVEVPFEVVIGEK